MDREKAIKYMHDLLRMMVQKDGSDLPGEDNTDLTLTDAVLSDSGVYRCIAGNGAGSDTSDPAVLAVLMLPPEVTVQPVGDTVIEGNTAH